MPLDLTRRHPPGVQGDYLLVEARKPPLTLRHHHRLERAVPISRDLKIDVRRVGLDPLARLAVARVAAVALLLGMLLVAQVRRHLAFQHALHQPARQIFHQARLTQNILGCLALNQSVQDRVQILLAKLLLFRCHGSLLLRILHHGHLHSFPYTLLLDELRIARADGSYSRLLDRLQRTAALLIDDFGLQALSETERRDLLEVLEDRYGQRATLVASQLPIDHWHDIVGDATFGDAILDRLVHHAHRIHLKGASMRRHAPESTT